MLEVRMLGGVYASFYLLVGAASVIVWHEGGQAMLGAASPAALSLMVAVAITEHYAFEANSYVFSLHRANTGSLMLFVRTGLWPSFAIAGLLFHWIASIEAVFVLWIGANLVVIGWAWKAIRAMELRQSGVQSAPARFDWRRTAGVWKEGVAFYIATVLLSGMQYAERFVAAPLLSHDEFGRYVFLWAIANAVQTVSYTVFVVTAGPSLVRAACSEPRRVTPILRRVIVKILAVTVAISLAVFSVHDLIFRFAHKSLGTGGRTTLVILLASFVLRSGSDLLWSAAIALKAGRQVAFGMFTLGVISVPLAWIAIPRFGQQGAAVSHLFASVMIAAWLAWVISKANKGLHLAGLTDQAMHRAG
ncbi:phosphoribosylaminoimidazole carboxylase [Paraburkholderia sp. IMGN_8]|uniref:lipopolysaccharide biosynthesis protein n=1 Tax=Paraburkholderia sp. IMGN_8 TaxID=3136564 RepID=UPI003101273D